MSIVEGITQFITWGDCESSVCWSESPYCWEDVNFIIESFGGGGRSQNSREISKRYRQLDPEDQKRVRIIVAEVAGKRTQQVYDLDKTAKPVVKDIELTLKKFIKIKLVEGIK